jgi:glycosyltransferase involved in cell wall biosynthesis
MPGYANLEVVLPPVRRMLAYVRELRPDVIHVSTPGPVGLVGRLAARRLRVPLVGTYHTDFPAYVDRLFDDAALTWIAGRATRWFYRPFDRVLARSAASAAALHSVGITMDRVATLPAGIDTVAFHPRHRDPALWRRLVVRTESVKVLYVGRISVEKNMPTLARVWPEVRRRATARGCDADLIVVGDGPYREPMERELGGVHFLGFRHGPELSAIYASADLFVFPSVTDTLGQAVMEAQASGVPAIVSDRGGPKETVLDGTTGWVLPDEPRAWTESIAGLVADPARRVAFGAAAHAAMRPRTFAASFEHFWSEHEAAGRS